MCAVCVALLFLAVQVPARLSQACAEDKPHAAADFVIALPVPLSGPRAAIGKAVAGAGSLAVARLNAVVGSNKLPLRLIIVDDACAPVQATTAAAEIIAAKPDAVIGHPCANAATAAAPLYAKAGLLYIATGAVQAKLPSFSASALTLRIPAHPTPVGTFLGSAYSTSAPAETRIALVRDRTLLARGIMQDVLKELTRLKHSPAVVDTISGGDKDFSLIVGRLKAANVTHLVLVAFPNEAALLVAEARGAIPQLAISAPDVLADPEFARIAGAHAEGLNIAMTTDLSMRQADERTTEVSKFLADDPVAATPSPSGTTDARIQASLAAYAAVEALAASLQNGAEKQPAAIAKFLIAGTFDTIAGPLSFDARGETKQSPWTMHVWREGKLVPAQSH